MGLKDKKEKEPEGVEEYRVYDVEGNVVHVDTDYHAAKAVRDNLNGAKMKKATVTE